MYSHGNRGWCVTLLLAVLASRASADIGVTIDILDAGDPGGPASAGRVVADVYVNMPETDAFTNAGITGRTQNGAIFTFDQEPNSVFFPPGGGDHFVTFGSAAYGRNASARYFPASTPEEQGIQLVSAWEIGPFPTITPTRLDLVYGTTPINAASDDPANGRDGFVLRVSLATAGVTFPGADDPGNYRVFAPGTEPPGYEPVFLADSNRLNQAGFQIQSHFQTIAFDWGIYVPEPNTTTICCGLLALLFGVHRRSRL